MISREALEAIWATCPLCGTKITSDQDGCIQCETCLQKARDADDYSILSGWWRKVDHIETWILDGRKIQSSKVTGSVEEQDKQ